MDPFRPGMLSIGRQTGIALLRGKVGFRALLDILFPPLRIGILQIGLLHPLHDRGVDQVIDGR
ncbi:MAG: hypothetical protein ACM3YO_07475, partial [Bacteroidota bacterium]